MLKTTTTARGRQRRRGRRGRRRRSEQTLALHEEGRWVQTVVNIDLTPSEIGKLFLHKNTLLLADAKIASQRLEAALLDSETS